MAGSFGLSVKAWLDIRGAEEPFVMELWRWISVGKFQVPIGLQVDQLSAVMLLVVTGVGFLIFVYSKGYMHGDTGYYRFYAYLSLFAFSMLMLVLANNYLLLYLGWEAVGLCSYYLIGFFYHKKSAASAGKKAFIINRVGDFGFGLGVMLIFVTLGTLNYTEVFHSVGGGALSEGMAVAIALLLFMGRWESRPSFRSMYGCRMPWRVPLQCPPCFMLPPWSRQECTWWPGARLFSPARPQPCWWSV